MLNPCHSCCFDASGEERYVFHACPCGSVRHAQHVHAYASSVFSKWDKLPSHIVTSQKGLSLDIGQVARTAKFQIKHIASFPRSSSTADVFLPHP